LKELSVLSVWVSDLGCMAIADSELITWIWGVRNAFPIQNQLAGWQRMCVSLWWLISLVNYYRSTLCESFVFAVVQCPSVCPSRCCILSRRQKV